MEAFVKGIAALLLVCAVIFGVATIVNSSQPEPQPTYTLSLNTSNAALMHKYGLPTKADCMEYHVNGKWGYKQGSMYRVFDELPGDSRAWDSLYEIDSDNPGFDK